MESNSVEAKLKKKVIGCLSEDESFGQNKRAALLSSKVAYCLEDYDTALQFALNAGDLFTLDMQDTLYVDKIVEQALDTYKKSRHENKPINQSLEALINRVFERNLANKEFEANDKLENYGFYLNFNTAGELFLNEASAYVLVKYEELNALLLDPNVTDEQLMFCVIYYGICVCRLPHERYVKHKEKKFKDQKVRMIVVKRFVAGHLLPNILVPALGALLSEHLLESISDNFDKTDKMVSAGGGQNSVDKDIKAFIEDRDDLKNEMKRDLCLALRQKDYVKNNVYKCPDCKKDYVDVDRLKSHYQEKHLIECTETIAEDLEVSFDKDLTKSSANTLLEGKTFNQSIGKAPAKKEKKPVKAKPLYKCPECNQFFPTQTLYTHLRSGLRNHGYSEEQIDAAKENLGIKAKQSRKRHFKDE